MANEVIDAVRAAMDRDPVEPDAPAPAVRGLTVSDDDPMLIAAEAGAGMVAGALAAFGGLDLVHVFALVALSAIYVAGLAIRLRLRRHARDRRATDTID